MVLWGAVLTVPDLPPPPCDGVWVYQARCLTGFLIPVLSIMTAHTQTPLKQHITHTYRIWHTQHITPNVGKSGQVFLHPFPAPYPGWVSTVGSWWRWWFWWLLGSFLHLEPCSQFMAALSVSGTMGLLPFGLEGSISGLPPSSAGRGTQLSSRRVTWGLQYSRGLRGVSLSASGSWGHYCNFSLSLSIHTHVDCWFVYPCFCFFRCDLVFFCMCCVFSTCALSSYSYVFPCVLPPSLLLFFRLVTFGIPILHMHSWITIEISKEVKSRKRKPQTRGSYRESIELILEKQMFLAQQSHSDYNCKSRHTRQA